MSNPKLSATNELIRLIDDFCADDSSVSLVNLCTTDGFPVHFISKDSVVSEPDKLAAVSSTLAALSGSSAVQMNQGSYEFSIIEAEHGNILFIQTQYLGAACVLTVSAKSKMILATARYKTKKLAGAIAQLTPSLF